MDRKKAEGKILWLMLCVITGVGGAVISALIKENHNEKEKCSVLEERAAKNAAVIKTFDLWMQWKQKNKSVSTFCERNCFQEVAIYGMHYLGERLLDELEGTSVSVKYAIDKNIGNRSVSVKVVTPDEDLEKVDAIIVTAFFFFDEIEQDLESKIECPIVSIEDVVYGS